MLFIKTSVFAQIEGETGQLHWYLDVTSHTLTISGNGAMPDYLGQFQAFAPSPWYDYKEFIHTVIIEDGVTSIGISAFNGEYSNLTLVTIPKSVKKIDFSAFSRCTGLTSIFIPNSVSYIEFGALNHYGTLFGAFSECTSLASIDFESGNNSYISENGVIFNKSQSSILFYPYSKIGGYVIPSTVTVINRYAFYERANLTSITIPNCINNIEFGSFFGCKNLTSINIPSSLTSIETVAFGLCNQITSITNLAKPIQYHDYFNNGSSITLRVPTSLVSSYQIMSGWKDFIIVGGGFLVNPIASDCEHGFTTGNALYDGKATATATATARSGYKFVNWTKKGVVISTDNPYNFTVTEDVELVANFESIVGIEAIDSAVFKIYPNPTNEQVIIESEKLSLENAEFSIYNSIGKLMIQGKLRETATINVKSLISGMYFLKIADVTVKFVKE